MELMLQTDGVVRDLEHPGLAFLGVSGAGEGEVCFVGSGGSKRREQGSRELHVPWLPV